MEHSTCTARWKSARTILYHQTDSDSWCRIWLAVFKRVSVMQTDFIHSFMAMFTTMDEGIQYNTEEWRWKKTIPMSFYNVILCPYHGTVLAIQIHVTYNAAGRAAKQVKWNCDPLKKWWRTSISAEYPNCVCNKYIIQYGTVRYGTYAMFSLPQLTGRGTVAHEQTAMRVERGGFRYG